MACSGVPNYCYYLKTNITGQKQQALGEVIVKFSNNYAIA